MPEANRPDWKEIVHERLRLPSSAREAIPEIAAHLEEIYDEALAGGLTATAAIEFTLHQVEDWRALRKSICRAKCKEGTMNPRTKTLWLPAIAVLFAAGLALVLVLKPHSKNSPPQGGHHRMLTSFLSSRSGPRLFDQSKFRNYLGKSGYVQADRIGLEQELKSTKTKHAF